MTDEVIITINIDHNSADLGDIENAFLDHQRQHGVTTLCSYQRESYMQRFYQDTKTNSVTLGAIGHRIKEASFTPSTHFVLGWYTSLDMCVFKRALIDHSHLIDCTPYKELVTLRDDDNTECLQPVDIARLLHKCTNLYRI